jgi:hypothetical protein
MLGYQFNMMIPRISPGYGVCMDSISGGMAFQHGRLHTTSASQVKSVVLIACTMHGGHLEAVNPTPAARGSAW